MSVGRKLAWITVGGLFLIPVNWFRLDATGGLPAGSDWKSTAIGTLVFWGLSGALAYFLVVSARGKRIQQAKEEQAMRDLMAQPLTPIRPAQALLKPGESAYGVIAARLHEVKTVGYSAGTRGASVHVAKGLTLRTSGTRGHAIKKSVAVAAGELVVTDKRVLFAGDNKSFALSLDKLLNVTNYADGFAFHDDKATYTLSTAQGAARVAFAVALHKVTRGA